MQATTAASASATALLDLAARLGRDPVDAARPVGDPVDDDPRFEQIRAHVDALGAVPWADVVRLSTELLASRGKDLRVAAYLAVGLAWTHGHAGFAAGLGCCADLCEGSWLAMYPPVERPRRRAAAIEWLVERGERWVLGRDPAPADAPSLDQSITHARRLGTALSERLGDDAPAVSILERAIRGRSEALAVTLAEAEAARGSAEAAGPAIPTHPTSPATPASPLPPAPIAREPAPEPPAAASRRAEAPARPAGRRPLDDLGKSVLEVLDALRRETPEAPLPYRLARAWCWAGLAAAPPARAGRTTVPPPPVDVLPRWTAALARGEAAAALDDAERRWQSKLLWLDPHRVVDEALAARGPGAEPARRAVREEVAHLLRRVPDLLGLEFADGQPLATEATRAWALPLVGEAPAAAIAPVTPAPAVSSGPPPQAPRPPDGVGEKSLSDEGGDLVEVLRLVNERRIEDAARRLERLLKGEGSRRGRFRLKAWFAHRLIDHGRSDAASALLAALDEEVAAHRIEDWEPELATEVVRGLVRVAAAGRPGTDGEDLARLRLRLCRLDAVSHIDPR